MPFLSFWRFLQKFTSPKPQTDQDYDARWERPLLSVAKSPYQGRDDFWVAVFEFLPAAEAFDGVVNSTVRVIRRQVRSSTEAEHFFRKAFFEIAKSRNPNEAVLTARRKCLRTLKTEKLVPRSRQSPPDVVVKFVDELTRWCELWNQTDSWCRDHVTEKAVLTVVEKCFPDLHLELLRKKRPRRAGDIDPPRHMCAEPQPFTFEWRTDTSSAAAFKVKMRPYDISIDDREYEREVEAQTWHKFLQFYEGRAEVLVGKADEISANLARFRKLLDEHVDGVLGQYGFNERKSDDQQHFQWLVIYQLGRKTYREIGDSHGLTRKNIEIAVKKKAKLIGLSLRKAKRTGRPRGKKEVQRRRRAARSKPSPNT